MKLTSISKTKGKSNSMLALVVILGLVTLSTTYLGISLQKNQTTQNSMASVGKTILVCANQDNIGECDYSGGDFPDGNGDAIQAAIDAAEEGDTILIKAGTYMRRTPSIYVTNNNQKRNCFVSTSITNVQTQQQVNKSVNLVGEKGTVLDGISSAKMNGICAKSGNLKIENMVLLGFKKDEATCFKNDDKIGCSRGHGIQLGESVNVDIKSMEIKNNEGDGISLFDNAVVSITGTKVSANGFDGISFTDMSNGIVKNSIVSLNAFRGIQLVDNSSVTVVSTTINNNGVDRSYDNRSRSGINLSGASKADVSNTIISGQTGIKNAFGISIFGTSMLKMNYSVLFDNKEGNFRIADTAKLESDAKTIIEKDPMIVDPLNNNFLLQNGSPAKDSGDEQITDLDGSRSDIGAYGGPDVCILDLGYSGCQK